MSTRVILVRHGQSTYNLEKRIQGRSDASVLTPHGRTDAERVAAALRGLSFDAIYCSPLRRARETAEIICSGLESAPPLQPTERLLEVDLPLWENLTKHDVLERYPDEYRCWHEQPHEFVMRAGDREFAPVLELFAQARQFWEELLDRHAGGTVLIIAHNGINRSAIATAIGMDPARYQTLQQSNCGINVLNFTGKLGETVQIESLNQTAHLGIPLPPPRRETGIRMLLVRHGETEWNRASRFQGQIDVPLNDTGREQGRRAADLLKTVPLDFAVTSPMLRPKETAELILSQQTQPVALDLKAPLVEIAHGEWEGKLEPEIKVAYPDLLRMWKETPAVVQMPGGENLAQVWERATACWQDVVRQQAMQATGNGVRTGIVVAHDAINKSILCALLGLEPKDFWSVKQGNGAVSVIDYPDGLEGMPVLQSINITTHLSSGVLDKTAAGAL
ncbi:fructose-2,6-bisphosphatase [Rubidibacter lacunae KORDI 51-2]|uniref:Fructose-2,6-bisphosphatase n=1 Tax=Rubidibacter lacunae KORDI 51-2 TaxID=582515 RepID=U5DQC9_9CHRO|nr:histidine phosphatase family protein [Rubidibacter lacunae]ERN43047.1 fructose-2,6-bisphosphatase [Rubidibacter lacunae KORDI 51-2]